jgi:hypothetical protein
MSALNNKREQVKPANQVAGQQIQRNLTKKELLELANYLYSRYEHNKKALNKEL